MAISETEFNKLLERVTQLEQYVEQKKVQQISFPLDEASKNIILNI